MAEEVKEIGVAIDLTGSFFRTELVDGKLTLQAETILSDNSKIYHSDGNWTSKIINLGDKFKEFGKVFVDSVQEGDSSFTIQTRSSSNSSDWSSWMGILADGTIQSPVAQYIQIRINLVAGKDISNIVLPKADYLADNEFITTKSSEVEGGYKVPQLTSNTSSGLAFASSSYAVANEAWKAFDKTVGSIYASSTLEINNGFLGYLFKESLVVSKYRISSTSTASLVNSTAKDFVLEGSKDTNNGKDGTWIVLNSQTNQVWTANQQREYEVENSEYFKAYRIRWTSNNGGVTYTSINELDFFSPQADSLVLKKDFEFDMSLDTTWTDEGSLHRKEITREEWLRIDKMEVITIDK